MAKKPTIRVIRWRHLLLGFEATEFLEDLSRTEHITKTRDAIEAVFTSRALRRWNSEKWKTAPAKAGENLSQSLARILSDELNDGIRKSQSLSFHVDANEPIVGITRSSRAAITPLTHDIKPDGVECWYCGRDCWMDCIEFQIFADREGFRSNAWTPDARHPVLGRLEFDCPFRP
jgi:hypothetical protein